MKTDVLITLLSWEDRYFLGLEKDIADYNPDKVIMLRHLTNSEWKSDNYQKTQALLKDRLLEITLDAQQPAQNWATFSEVFSKHGHNVNILVDITTMTREIIWLTLFNCKLHESSGNFIYYKPASYADEWISRDPGKPRLLYRMSGIHKLNAPTLLVVTAGYDLQRIDSLIHYFEPKDTIIFCQTTNNRKNEDNFKTIKSIVRHKYNIETVLQYDAYDVKSCQDLIIKTLTDTSNSNSFLDTHNIIMNSLGPKTSAIALFNIWQNNPQIALSYLPSKEYNKEYSSGIGEVVTGELKF